MNQLSTDQITYRKRLYDSGYNCAQIGRIVGTTRQAVWESLNRHFSIGARCQHINKRFKKIDGFAVHKATCKDCGKFIGWYRYPCLEA